MLQIVINGNYYKENVYFSSWNARQKKNCVYFYDYDEYVLYIINSMEYSEIQRLRLKIYQMYQKQLKFTKIYEKDVNGEIITGWHIESPVIGMEVSDFARLLDNGIRKKFFVYDPVREKYSYRSDFINYVNLNV